MKKQQYFKEILKHLSIILISLLGIKVFQCFIIGWICGIVISYYLCMLSAYCIGIIIFPFAILYQIVTKQEVF